MLEIYHKESFTIFWYSCLLCILFARVELAGAFLNALSQIHYCQVIWVVPI